MSSPAGNAVLHTMILAVDDAYDEMLIAPVHGRLLFTGEPIDDRLAERLVDLALDGVAASSTNHSRAR